MTRYAKEDDYTLLVTNDFPGGGTLSRYFNFAAEQVTTIFSQKAEKELSQKEYYGNAAVSSAVSVALTSQMQIQKFSELDSQAEVERMREELIRLEGKPPVKDDMPGKPRIKPVSVANGPIAKL